MPISRVLSRTDHRQRPDDIEGRDDADQEDDEPHRELLELSAENSERFCSASRAAR